VGHLLFGDFVLGLTGSILVGAIPGVWIGARVSSRSPGSLVRRALAVVMLASGTKLLGASHRDGLGHHGHGVDRGRDGLVMAAGTPRRGSVRLARRRSRPGTVREDAPPVTHGG
jgi:hypothetical protein